MKPALVSGVQPTGRLHIGNYLGALKNFVDLQSTGRYDCHFIIVDLHALTEFIPPKEQHRNIIHLAADFLAAGIDPRQSLFFQQSQVAAHSELTWIFNTLTPMGELSRMTQYKDKSDKHGATAGLFTYPTLMAADILLYDPKYVPVGDDQSQHLEFTRTLVRKFNERFGRTFIEPKALFTEAPRVMSLGNPSKKMSKSDPANCLFIDDQPYEIINKVRRAVTDSGSEIVFDPERKPAIANLLRIYAGVTGQSTRKLEQQYRGVGYGTFKQELGQAIADHFAPFRKKKKQLLADPKRLINILKRGSAKARKRADAKMAIVRKRIGIAL
jgi:tryptophanyl-tRNA synthetase